MAVLCACWAVVCPELFILEVSPLKSRGSSVTFWEGVCFPLWAEALLARAQEGTSCLSGLFCPFL